MEDDRIRELTLAKREHSYTINLWQLNFLLRHLLLASWLPKATQLPRQLMIRGLGHAPKKGLKFRLFEIAL